MATRTQLKTYGMQQKQLRGKFIVIQSYLRKQDNLTLYLKQLEKEEQKNPKKSVEGKKSLRSKQK